MPASQDERFVFPEGFDPCNNVAEGGESAGGGVGGLDDFFGRFPSDGPGGRGGTWCQPFGDIWERKNNVRITAITKYEKV